LGNVYLFPFPYRDGIHWAPEGQRYVTNLVLTHLYLQENKPLPGRNLDDYALERVIMIHDIEKGKYQINGQVEHDKMRQQLKILEIIANRLTNTLGRWDLPPAQTLLRTAREKIRRENEIEAQKEAERAAVAAGTAPPPSRGGPGGPRFGGPGPRFDPYSRGPPPQSR